MYSLPPIAQIYPPTRTSLSITTSPIVSNGSSLTTATRTVKIVDNKNIHQNTSNAGNIPKTNILQAFPKATEQNQLHLNLPTSNFNYETSSALNPVLNKQKYDNQQTTRPVTSSFLYDDRNTFQFKTISTIAAYTTTLSQEYLSKVTSTKLLDSPDSTMQLAHTQKKNIPAVVLTEKITNKLRSDLPEYTLFSNIRSNPSLINIELFDSLNRSASHKLLKKNTSHFKTLYKLRINNTNLSRILNLTPAIFLEAQNVTYSRKSAIHKKYPKSSYLLKGVDIHQAKKLTIYPLR